MDPGGVFVRIEIESMNLKNVRVHASTVFVEPDAAWDIQQEKLF